MGAGVTEAAQPPPPPRRTRREHSKSRNGCTVCKRRHVRCDQGRPIWYKLSMLRRVEVLLIADHSSSCLVRGDQCIYERHSPTDSTSRGQSMAIRLRRDTTSSPIDLTGRLADPFESWGIDMPYHSDQLLYHRESQGRAVYFVLL